ncbi:MAG: FAD/NAD(P)-binding protein [Actinomycetia bacterium]|nr:FAD/NAD(P)-binding protein [Actinomycetes bacterium]
MRIAVVGGGVVGMSALTALIDGGNDAVCYEPGPVMGERSAGSTRLFRLAHADPQLVRVAQAARDGFGRWESVADRPMLVNCGCLITGTDMADRASAMASAGASYELIGPGPDRLRLPVVDAPTEALLDVGGGVVDVDALRDLLVVRAGHAVVREPVYRLSISPHGAAVVTGAGGVIEFDAVVLAAGASTSHLAAQVGIYTPPLLAHHVRFTFTVEGTGWHSWIDKPASGLSTYQHEAGPGRWAVGGQVDPAETAWERGREHAIAESRRVIVDYAASFLTVRPEIVDSLYCTTVPNLGDGVEFRRNGPILAIYGDNMMKFAPVLGEALAEAAVSGGTPSVASLVQDRT